eukprot:GHVU01200142.1.p1 GENE.GHVU01200142.1~~GHVU01200142.1.p1  ORF type:complete len:118 (-),score=23.22 GHVU01200142.1:739-1092(-)
MIICRFSGPEPSLSCTKAICRCLRIVRDHPHTVNVCIQPKKKQQQQHQHHQQGTGKAAAAAGVPVGQQQQQLQLSYRYQQHQKRHHHMSAPHRESPAITAQHSQQQSVAALAGRWRP